MYLQVYIFLLPPLAARKAGDKGGRETEKERKEGIKTGLGFRVFWGWWGDVDRVRSPFSFLLQDQSTGAAPASYMPPP